MWLLEADNGMSEFHGCLVQVPGREPVACGSYACISLDMDVCAALTVECGSHSKCVASPDDDEGYMCVQQSSFNNKSYTIIHY